jgi:hypothetical protein
LDFVALLEQRRKREKELSPLAPVLFFYLLLPPREPIGRERRTLRGRKNEREREIERERHKT